MTDKEIIKALEYCFTNDWNRTKCDKCEFYTGTTQCVEDLKSASIDLINRQQAEIERLMDLNDTVIADLKYYLDNNEENGVVYFPKFFVEKILSNLKEMVGE